MTTKKRSYDRFWAPCIHRLQLSKDVVIWLSGLQGYRNTFWQKESERSKILDKELGKLSNKKPDLSKTWNSLVTVLHGTRAKVKLNCKWHSKTRTHFLGGRSYMSTFRVYALKTTRTIIRSRTFKTFALTQTKCTGRKNSKQIDFLNGQQGVIKIPYSVFLLAWATLWLEN